MTIEPDTSAASGAPAAGSSTDLDSTLVGAASALALDEEGVGEGDDGGVDGEDGDPPRTYPKIFDHWIFGPDPVIGACCLVVTGVFIALYVKHFGTLTSDIHNGFGTSSFDIGLYDQGVWLLSRFKAPFITQMGRNLFGDHTQFMLVTLVPFYWIRPDATTLLWVQAFVLAIGAVPVYMLTMRRMNNPVFATIFAGAFLLYPALAQTNLENYHPDSFLVPILGFAIYAAVENKPRMFITFSILALLCKEDVVLILLPLALWYAWRRNRRLGGLVAGASIAYAAFATYVVMKSLIGVPTLNTWRIPYGGPGGFIKEFLKKPADVIKYLIKSDHPNGRPFYVWQILAPTGLMMFVAPEVAATVILVLASNVVSSFGYQHQIAYHYSMVLIPGIILGTVYAVSKLKTEKLRVIAVTIVAASSVWCAYLWGPFPFSVHKDVPHWAPSNPAVAEINQVLDQVPKNAVISSYYSFAPHLAHRERIYMWPTPFHAVYWNTFKQEGQRLPEADDVEYLVLPADLQDHKEAFEKIQDQFQEIARSQNAVLYKRKAG